MTLKEIQFEHRVSYRTVLRWLKAGILRRVPSPKKRNFDVILCHTSSIADIGR